MSKENTNDTETTKRERSCPAPTGYADKVLNQLEDGHIFASAAWKLIHKKSEMGDMDWIREVGKEAVNMAHAEIFSAVDMDNGVLSHNNKKTKNRKKRK